MKKSFFLTLLIVFLLIPIFNYAQQTVGLFLNQPDAYNGYTLFNSFGSNSTYLIDNCGTKVFEWNSNHAPGAVVYLLEDGHLLRTNRLDSTSITIGGYGGRIEILDSNSSVIWQYEVNSDSTIAHHDVAILPNGNILILAVELISGQKADDFGSQVIADRYSEMILEVNPSINQIVWEWHAWDHLIQDIDSTKVNYGTISEDPGRININYAFLEDGSDPDWIHANSIDYNADLDQIMLNSPHFNEFWIIDHSTTTAQAADSIGGFSGKGGDILYRWGNAQAYNRGDSTDQIFEFQHDAHWIPSGLPDEGKIMVFNNGQDRGYSSVDILEPPLDTSNLNNYHLNIDPTPYGPFELYWSYSDSVNFYSPKISGVQQLQNGNVFICSGQQGRLFEIRHQTDAVVWEYIIPVSPLGPLFQGEEATGNAVFRSHRFSTTYSGFDNLTLTPTAVIEQNPLPSNCQIYILGCTDSSSCNYNHLANVDDNTCVYPEFSQQSVSVCYGDSITVGGNVYFTSGNYTETLTSVNGCDSTVTTILNIYPDIVSIVSQSENNITATSFGGVGPYSYEWNTSEITQIITPLANGDYWVIISDVNGCESDTAFFSVNWLTTSIAEIDVNNFNFFPNPSNDLFNISFNSITRQDIDLYVQNLLGKVIFNKSLKDFSGDFSKSISLLEHPSAVYILKLETNNGIIIEKLVLQK
jgi:hypothetical protein